MAARRSASAPQASTPEPAPQPQVTPAHAWNLEGLYELPSGNIARLKRPGVLALASMSNGHNLISDAVLSRVNEAADAPTTPEERAAVIRRNGAVYSAVARLVFVAPRIVPEGVEPKYEAGEIAIGDLTDDDLYFAYYTIAQGDARSVAPFRVG